MHSAGFSLEGRTALVTGGNGGLGRAIAMRLRRAGARVAITGPNPEKNAAVAVEVGQGSVFTLDVRDEQAVENVVEQTVERYGRLDVLVNCAGDFKRGSALEMPLEDWERVIGSHLTGTFPCSKHAGRAMVAGGEGGKIIDVGSMYSLFGPPGYPNYAAAKTGIVGLTQALGGRARRSRDPGECAPPRAGSRRS